MQREEALFASALIRIFSCLTAVLPAVCVVMLTFAVYGTLAYGQYKKLMSLPPHPFKVLLPTVAVPSEAVAAEAPPAVAVERKEK